jgi:hypothetical protein
MGADFLFDCIIIKKGKDLKQLEQDLITKAQSLTIKDFKKADIERLEMNFDLIVDVDTLPKIVDDMASWIADTFEALNNRECGFMTFKGYHIYLTGGMSWGDAPTDAFDIFYKFNSMPLCLHKLLN